MSIDKARKFASEKHAGQLRKYTNEPYYNHCEAVAKLVSDRYPFSTDMIIAALLHDTIEDTNTTYQEIKCEFGDTVADYVISLTDTSKAVDGNREARKKIDREKFENSCWEVKTIKMADLIDNSKTICVYAPGFAKVYMREKALLFDILANREPRADVALSSEAYNILLSYYNCNKEGA